MVVFKINTIINAPVDVVVKALGNPENHTYWTTDLERFESVKGGPEEVGSVALLHYVQKGRQYTMEDKLIYCDPGEKYISQVTGDTILAEVETILSPLDNNTEVNLKWSGRGKTCLLKVLLPLFRRKVKELAKRDLEKFRVLVEERGSSFKI